MSSKVGQIRDLSLFDHRSNGLNICGQHAQKAQAAIAATIDDLYQNNKEFHTLFENVLSSSGRAPLTFSVTHDAISIKLSGKTHTLEFADLGKTDNSKEIRDKSQKLLKKINTIYTRCLNEDNRTSTPPLRRSRVRPLSASPHSSRSSGSRRSSSIVSENTVESEAKETRSKTTRKSHSSASPRSSRSSQTRRPSTSSKRTEESMAEERSSRSSHLSTRTAPAKTSRYAHVPYTVLKASRGEKSARSSTIQRADGSLLTRGRAPETASDTATRAFEALTAAHEVAKRAFEELKAKHDTTVSDLATTRVERDSAVSDLAAERDVATRALESFRADLRSNEERLVAKEQEIEKIRAFFDAARLDNPRVDLAKLKEWIQFAALIEHPSEDNPVEITPAFFNELPPSTISSLSRYMYYIIKKKPGYTEPANESERWDIGKNFFCNYQDGYLGTHLSPQELNKARADATRFFVLECIANDFNTHFLEGRLGGEPDPDLLALYETLPEDMRHGIEGQLWQIAAEGSRDVVSDFGNKAFRGIDGQTATNAQRAEAIRHFMLQKLISK